MKTKVLLNLFHGIILLFLSGCLERGSEDPKGSGGSQSGGNQNWMIPVDQVLDGGPGKDGIPALANPSFISSSEASYLQDNDLVLGLAVGNEVRAYSHKVLDWHEIINDDLDDVSVAVIYCPLTGTGIGWNRNLSAGKTTFGVSGLLYNNNIIPYDRLTDSNWSQMLFKSVKGSLSGQSPDVINLVETNWKTWKEMFPDTKVVSTQTGHNRNYNNYPYGDYRTNHKTILFPSSRTDNRLPAKERVLGLMDGKKAKAYSIEKFKGGTSLINDVFSGKQITVVGSKERNFIIAFNRELPDGTVLSFEPVANEASVILVDQEGNKWDLFGKAVSGPKEGLRLDAFPQMMGYWFSWAPFFENLELFE